MIRVTLFCTLRAFRVQFSHVRVFSDSRNVQKRATKSDTSGHCLVAELLICIAAAAAATAAAVAYRRRQRRSATPLRYRQSRRGRGAAPQPASGGTTSSSTAAPCCAAAGPSSSAAPASESSTPPAASWRCDCCERRGRGGGGCQSLVSNVVERGYVGRQFESCLRAGCVCTAAPLCFGLRSCQDRGPSIPVVMV